MAHEFQHAPVPPSQYLRFFDSLNRHGIRYLVIGGIAMNLHGSGRSTFDIDVVVDASLNQADEWRKVMEETAVQPFNSSFDEMYDAERRKQLLEEKNLIAFCLNSRTEPHGLIDVMFDPPWDFRQAYGRRIEKTLGGVTIPVVGLEDLITMKETAGREKDLGDLEVLKILKSRQ